MQDLEKLSLEEYLRKLGFDGETAEMMLTYTTNEIDKTALHEKIKFLISLGLEPRNIRIVVEEDITFMTEELSLIVKNAEVLKSYLNKDELIDALEVTPELLTVKEGNVEENIKLLRILITDIETLKVLLIDKGEILTYSPKYLSERLSFLVENDLKSKIVKILIEETDIFDLDVDEIDLDYLKSL